MDDERKIIFLVDDQPANLATGREMLKEAYKVYPIPSGEIMFGLLEKVHPDMILLDISMPDMDGYESIKKLKANPAWQDIPVIFLTAMTEGSRQDGLSLGAIDYVLKPFSAPLLLKRIGNHLLTQALKHGGV